MPIVTLPSTIANGQLIDANPVMANFNALANAINTLLVPLAGPATLTGVFTFTASPQVPTATLGDNTLNAASTAFVQNALSGVGAGSPSFKNKIINGSMLVNQRSGASTTPSGTGLTYVIDRWALSATVGSKFLVQWSGSTAVVNYNHALNFSVSAAVAVPAASDTWFVVQRIEADQIRDLNFGTASASPITLSFWVNSSLTGTHSGCVQNHNNTRSYPFTFTIAAASTWTFITVTIAGDTAGTWLNGSQGGGTQPGVLGMELRLFNLGSGANFLAAAGAWTAGNFTGVTGSVQIVTTGAAQIAVTGVRLEKGSAATTDEVLPLEIAVALCQRYFEKSFPLYTAPGQNLGVGGAFTSGQIVGASTAQTLGGVVYKVQKRNASGAITLYNPSAASAEIRNTTLGSNWTASATVNASEYGFGITGTTPGGSAAGNGAAVNWSVDNEL